MPAYSLSPIFRSIGGFALILRNQPLLFVSYLETYATALRGTTGTAYTLVDALSLIYILDPFVPCAYMANLKHLANNMTLGWLGRS